MSIFSDYNRSRNYLLIDDNEEIYTDDYVFPNNNRKGCIRHAGVLKDINLVTKEGYAGTFYPVTYTTTVNDLKLKAQYQIEFNFFPSEYGTTNFIHYIYGRRIYFRRSDDVSNDSSYNNWNEIGNINKGLWYYQNESNLPTYKVAINTINSLLADDGYIQIYLGNDAYKEKYEEGYRYLILTYFKWYANWCDANVNSEYKLSVNLNSFLKQIIDWAISNFTLEMGTYLTTFISDLVPATTKTYTNSTWSSSKKWYIKTTFSKNTSKSNVVNYVTMIRNNQYKNVA